MWLMRIILFLGVCGYFNSVTRTQNIERVHTHIIKITEISQENPFPTPTPIEEGEEMAARY